MDQGWGEVVADALIADAQTFSADLEKSLSKVQIEESIETWLSQAL
jgi:hypothetical protein